MLLKKTILGVSPVSIAEASSFLKLNGSNADIDNVAAMLDSAVTHAETFLGRDVRANTYELLTDGFGSDFAGGLIQLRAVDVASITSIEYLLNDVWTTVTAADYRLVKGRSTSCVELVSLASWPDDADDVPHNVRVIFVTEGPLQISLVKQGVLKHIGAIHADRGDAESPTTSSDSMGAAHTGTVESAKQSGAEGIYGPLAWPRI